VQHDLVEPGLHIVGGRECFLSETTIRDYVGHPSHGVHGGPEKPIVSNVDHDCFVFASFFEENRFPFPYAFEKLTGFRG
jgi:hypothetical protein